MADAALSAIVQACVLGGVPLLLFYVFRRWRHKRTFADVARLAGLQIGVPRYLGYSLAFATVGLIALLVWSPELEPFTREGSAQRPFQTWRGTCTSPCRSRSGPQHHANVSLASGRMPQNGHGFSAETSGRVGSVIALRPIETTPRRTARQALRRATTAPSSRGPMLG